jgi:CRISPR-associated endonuclease/helicase Cas3
MTPLGAADFDAFFGALYRDHEARPLAPFPWQRRLVRRILGDGVERPAWPRVLALPTASGKTAAIDVAVFTLACQADAAPGARTAPRRIFFVVDRRVIVDEAFDRARRLAEALAEAQGGVLGRVAERLRALGSAGPDEPPLAAYELRGGIYRDDAWAKTPLQPAVIASTVDQIGSRLLHRGYGVSSRSWPIHAGLAAHDALVILDEAHCSQPFGETVEAVARYRSWSEEPPPGPFAYVAMTATPRPGVAGEEIFRLDDAADRAHPELARRLRAAKPARLLPPIPGKTGTGRLVQELCDQAETFARAGARRIAVLVNRVETARRVRERLDERLGERILMIGRMRPWDRDRLLERWRPFLAAGPDREAHERPIFIAATQCLEVGADLDFDAMVTECASLDALRQRFGRLNRLGREERAQGAVLIAGNDLKGGQEDFIYGPALQETWAWLVAHASEGEGLGSIDFGIDPFDALWQEAMRNEQDLVERLTPPAPHAPVMLPAHLDLWVQTSPVPAPDPDVSVFLHGPERGAPEVQVCWRLDLALPEGERPDWSELLARWTSTVALLPPTSAECLPVPLHVVRRWLAGAPRPAENLADVEGSTTQPVEEGDAEATATGRTLLRWRGPEDSELASRDHPPRPGDTLVIPAALGGWEVFGHIPPAADGRIAPDIAEPTGFKRRRRAVFRLHASLLERWPESAERQRLLELAGWSEATAEEGDLRQTAHALLRRAAEQGHAPEELNGVLGELLDHGFDALPHPSGHGWVLRGRRRRPAANALRASALALATETFTSDDDSASATTDVLLPDHCRGVAELAGRFARSCRLPGALVEDLRLAGRLHDLGKADPRFQAWLQGGSSLAGQLAPLLAKSERLPESARERERARRRAGYPRGGRHELVSLRLIESGPALLDPAADADLVRHLIASHHGRCRPFAPVVLDGEPAEVEVDEGSLRLTASSATALERIDSGVAERFWRLVDRYGWWGLALLEAILRLADHRRSEAEELQAAEAGTVARRASA